MKHSRWKSIRTPVPVRGWYETRRLYFHPKTGELLKYDEQLQRFRHPPTPGEVDEMDKAYQWRGLMRSDGSVRPIKPYGPGDKPPRPTRTGIMVDGPFAGFEVDFPIYGEIPDSIEIEHDTNGTRQTYHLKRSERGFFLFSVEVRE